MSRPQTVAAFTLVMVCVCSSDMLGLDTDRGLVLEALKTGILNSLGMKQPPLLKQRASQREVMEMEHLYEEKLKEMGLNSTRMYHVSTLLPHRERNLSDPHGGLHRGVFTQRPSVQDQLSVVQAELHISRPTSLLNRQVRVQIRGWTQMRHAVWTEDSYNGSISQSVVLDVSNEVQEWVRHQRRALVVDIGHRGHSSLNISLKVTLQHKSRLTRSNKEDDCDEPGLCCRQSLTVSFKDIGWTDWVVAPLEYTMYFCQGSCPHNYRPASMHTQVKSRLHQISKGGPRPCCVPSQYQPMVLMHYDSRGKLKLTPFQDLIVSKCHCA